MPTTLQILATKLYIPPPRPNVIRRPRLIERLNEGLCHTLTLISAPAGFGKTTLLSEWLAGCERPAAWLSLDAGDNDPARFLTYLIAALRGIVPNLSESMLAALQSPQPPPADVILTPLLNDLAATTDDFVLVLDDYHLLDDRAVDRALAFLLEHQPPQMHLVIATREDPQLPLARLRASGQLSELRAADLRFTAAEAAAFLTQVTNLALSAEDIAALAARTEGWIAGLQLAAISLQGYRTPQDAASFIAAFNGSHHFVMDYLVEEVLHQQPEHIQTFLLRTSILDRLCGSLCEAVALDAASPAISGQATLEYLEHANLFIVPLDDERRWYRYHHLFAELLRQRLRQASSEHPESAASDARTLHIRASAWFEEHGLEMEAFQHAAAAHDVERAERLIVGKGIPRHFHGAVTTMLAWLDTLPTDVLDARPRLRIWHAALLVINGQTTGVEEKLQAAETTLHSRAPDDATRDLIGQIATIRATLALTRYQLEGVLTQARRALEHLHPTNLFSRVSAQWALANAYQFQGDRPAASQAFTDALALGQASGDTFTTMLATIGLGNVRETENQLHLAADTYRSVLRLAGEQPQQIVYEAHLGLARICYEWNDLEAAEQYGQEGLRLARQYDRVIDRFIVCELFLARLKLARGDVAGAAALLTQAEQSARQHDFLARLPDVAAAQVPILLRQGEIAAAAHAAHTHSHPLSQARVLLAQGEPAEALAVLAAWRQQVEARGWKDELLRLAVLQALAFQAQGRRDLAVPLLLDMLARAEPEGFIRSFVDEGAPMAQLLSTAATTAHGATAAYIARLLAAFGAEQQPGNAPLPVHIHTLPGQPPVEPLSQRELEVLRLIAQGLSNEQIGERLFLALATVKGHNQRIFGKLQVQRRTEAVARARQLGLL